MDKIIISQAAEILGVSKRTLQRWDKSGYLKASREDSILKSRIYNKEGILRIKKWRELLKERDQIYSEVKNHTRLMITLDSEDWEKYFDDWEKRIKNNREERKKLLGI